MADRNKAVSLWVGLCNAIIGSYNDASMDGAERKKENVPLNWGLFVGEAWSMKEAEELLDDW